MQWYLVHTKPRQEKSALDNLHRQGYQCYLPTMPSEKLRQGLLIVADEPLFPRYLFIRLGLGDSVRSWAPICSTKGVRRLVSFVIEPARFDDDPMNCCEHRRHQYKLSRNACSKLGSLCA
jgi:transcriptional antiterminator RfaH